MRSNAMHDERQTFFGSESRVCHEPPLYAGTFFVGLVPHVVESGLSNGHDAGVADQVLDLAQVGFPLQVPGVIGCSEGPIRGW
jgi:hypothetical protein